MNLETIVPNLVIYFVPFLFALCFHEYAHGWVARRKGDRTAEIMGRLTMNPAAHVDPVGTLFLPIMSIVTGLPSIGWAKPVPVDSRNLKKPRQDMFWIALAGPLSNVLLAVVAAFVYAVVALMQVFPTGHAVTKILSAFIQINFLLALFNLIPMHPLDGGKIIGRFLPAKWDTKLEEHQNVLVFVLLGLMLMGGFRFIAPLAADLSYMLVSNIMIILGNIVA